MKKILLTIVLAGLFFSGRSQQLQNTYWHSFSSAGVPFLYWHFEQDTLKYSSTNVSFTSVSVFTNVGNNFVIRDVVGNCLSDTGRYTYTIVNDTLRFFVVEDSCASRAAVFFSYYFVSIPTGIDNAGAFKSIQVYPNPSTDGIFNLAAENNTDGFKKITVNTMMGEKVWEDNFNQLKTRYSINLQELPAGMYFLTLSNSNSERTFRIIK